MVAQLPDQSDDFASSLFHLFGVSDYYVVEIVG